MGSCLDNGGAGQLALERMASGVEPLEVTVLMPCLNEADTVATCVGKAVQCLLDLGVRGEVLVADNGSTDGSQRLATAAGARVVAVAARGYGAALIGGIEAARGGYVIMGDADDSYDFSDLKKFIDGLRAGADVVQGCRLPAGGGTILPGAMPFLHRWWGNPMFTLLARWMFRAPIHDIYCGLRGFRRDWWMTLNQRCTGMEFATEMLIKASLSGARIREVPITLHPDGRKAHAPHLKTFRDGWRTLRFFLMCSPRWLFLAPGALLVMAGLAGFALALPGIRLGRITLDAHTLVFASLSVICGWQAILFAVFTKTFAVSEGLLPADAAFERFFRIATLGRGLVLSCMSMLVGVSLLAWAFWLWHVTGYGALNYAHTMRIVVPGATLTALGFQTFLASWFTSILGLARR